MGRRSGRKSKPLTKKESCIARAANFIFVLAVEGCWLSELRPIRGSGRGSPQPLGVSAFGMLDSAADGRRFLKLKTTGGPQPYTVVLNWQAGLKK